MKEKLYQIEIFMKRNEWEKQNNSKNVSNLMFKLNQLLTSEIIKLFDQYPS